MGKKNISKCENQVRQLIQIPRVHNIHIIPVS